MSPMRRGKNGEHEGIGGVEVMVHFTRSALSPDLAKKERYFHLTTQHNVAAKSLQRAAQGDLLGTGVLLLLEIKASTSERFLAPKYNGASLSGHSGLRVSPTA